jgi:hypothetical protein
MRQLIKEQQSEIFADRVLNCLREEIEYAETDPDGAGGGCGRTALLCYAYRSA